MQLLYDNMNMEVKMKKILSALLVVGALLMFTGCSNIHNFGRHGCFLY